MTNPFFVDRMAAERRRDLEAEAPHQQLANETRQAARRANVTGSFPRLVARASRVLPVNRRAHRSQATLGAGH